MGVTENRAPEVAQPGAVRIRRALLTVSDKRGLVDFARGLTELGVELVSTGGTARELAEAGITTRAIDDYTGFPEILDGRVKTLNPRIYAGLLAVRSKPEHVATLAEQEIEPIDLVCVNLYPFERTASRRGVSTEEVVENIDIGGPTLIRAAAKNHPFAAVVVGPESYDAVIEEMRMAEGMLSEQTREALAMEAFAYTARYDAAIARWFSEREDDFPATYPRVYEKVLDLPYGENPHQRAAYYAQANARTHLLSMVSKLHGKELSFNNLLDLDAARRMVEEFEIPAAVIVKENIRILEDAERRNEPVADRDIRRVRGGLLVQDRDEDIELRDEMQVVTERKPSEQEWGEMLFAWKVCKHVRSNAIVLSRNLATAGIGAGQMSRVDSVRLALEKSTADSLEGAALARSLLADALDQERHAHVRAPLVEVVAAQPGGDDVHRPDVAKSLLR